MLLTTTFSSPAFWGGQLLFPHQASISLFSFENSTSNEPPFPTLSSHGLGADDPLQAWVFHSSGFRDWFRDGHMANMEPMRQI